MESTMSREFNVSIKDFQIIKNASLTFLPGLNCLIGQSNNGKSAILRATKAAIYNFPGTTSVRLGCSSYAVGVQANGHTVIFQKGGTTTYKVDGTTLSKPGRTQLPEVAEALGIKELNLNGSNEEINFLDQMEKPFLLDRSETELFRFIVDSGKDSNVTLALKSITQDRQQITRDITTTEGRLEQVGLTLKQQEENLKDSESRLALFQRVIDLGPRITRTKELSALKSAIMAQTEDYRSLTSKLLVETSAINLTTEPVEKINNLLKKQEVINILVSSITKATETKEVLETKLGKVSLVDGSKLLSLVDSYNKVSTVTSTINQQVRELDQLKSKKYPELKIDFSASIERLNTLSDLLRSINLYQGQIDQANSSLDVIKLELENTQKEIDSIGVCPMCGKPLHS